MGKGAGEKIHVATWPAPKGAIQVKVRTPFPSAPPLPCTPAPPLPRMFLVLLLSQLILPLLLTACLATVTPPAPVFIRIAGSTSMSPLVAALAEAYTAQHPHVTFDIQSGGSGLGRMLVETKQIEAGMVSWARPDLPEGLVVTPLARDAIAVILNQQNPSAGLSLAELRDIFSGRLLNWQEVDGPPRPIQVVSREDGSGSRAAFEAIVMEGQAVTPTAIVLPNSQAVVDFVARNPGAVGYVSFTFIEEGVYAAPVEGLTPTLASLNANSYPLIRELALVTRQPAGPEVTAFLEFALSPAGQALVGQRWGRVR